MDPIEKAIRAALEKGDATDPKHRERVYLSALSALERSLKTNPGLTQEAAARRREVVRQKIRAIETEFRPATEPVSDSGEGQRRVEPEMPANPVAPEPRVEMPGPGNPEGAPETDFVSQLRVTRNGEGAVGDRPVDPGPGPGPASDTLAPPRRRPFARMLIISLVLGFLGIGLWWLYSGQVLVPLSERDGAVPNPPAQLREDEFSPARSGEAGSLGNVPQAGSWITVFTPDDPTTVTAPSGTKADASGDGPDKALRITPSQPDSAAVFDLGEGILAQLAGKRVTFDINAAAPEGETTQMSIRCSLAELGDCGRKRFDVEASRGDFLFEIELPDRAPGSFGSISLTPDISQGRMPVDVYSIRVFIPDS